MAVKIGIADIRIAWNDEQAASGSGPLLKLVHPQPTFYTIGPEDDVPDLFDRVIKEVGNTKIELLSIYAHGYGERDVTGLHGGFGIELGKDHVTMDNADALFARFNGKFQNPLLGIELVGCEVAAQSRVKVGNTIKIGDGIKLCQTIAAAAGTCVRASSSMQTFNPIGEFTKVVPDPTAPLGRGSRGGVEVDPGPWEGNVWLICAKGRRLLSNRGGTF
jgi:hypothetical protein